MKYFFKSSLFATIAVAYTLVSCTKEEGISPASKVCLITSLSTSGDTVKNFYQYNANNKLLKSQAFKDSHVNSYSFNYTYNGNKVEQIYLDKDGSTGQAIVYTMGTNGYASLSVQTNKSGESEIMDSVFYTYNKDGFLTKQETRSYHKSVNGSFVFDEKIISTYTISNGNTIKEATTNGTTSWVTSHEFYDKKNVSNLYNPASLTGKSNKNLLKKSTGKDFAYSYQYELDVDNNPTKATLTEEVNGKSSQRVMFLTYSCQ